MVDWATIRCDAFHYVPVKLRQPWHRQFERRRAISSASQVLPLCFEGSRGRGFFWPEWNALNAERFTT
jgi:hypothetical protein